MKPSKAPFTAAQVDALIAQQKLIDEMPRLIERDGFARYVAPVLVNQGQDIGLILEAHVGLRSQIVSPNVTLRWSNIRIRAIDQTAVHQNIPGLEPVRGWHEHLWDDAYGDKRIQPVTPDPPQGLAAIFEFAARRWNIQIRGGTRSLDL